ncbi:acid protease [Mollisia scopiformis]|uniref:Acid protease n=1 Tax=Mollisia scopiformis TaxID=149040 RepID=A0A132B9L5_MOLSC|nr:acid protease [Mollisia scopiformis]KUJ09096.1 acid protease [Mollisia scopiformis]
MRLTKLQWLWLGVVATIGIVLAYLVSILAYFVPQLSIFSGSLSPAHKPITTEAGPSSLIAVDLRYQRIANRWSYMLDVSLGTPPQNVSLQVDTGAGFTWVKSPPAVGSTSCDNFSCRKNPLYHQQRSSTRKDLKRSFDYIYGKGKHAAKGNRHKDHIHIGGVTIPQFMFGIANKIVEIDDGVAGLVPHDKDSLQDQLFRGGKIASRIFGIYLGGATNRKGSLVLGGIDPKKYTGSLSRHDVVEHDYFKIRLDSVGVTKTGTTSVPVSQTSINVLLDTGCNHSILPVPVVESILEQIGFPQQPPVPVLSKGYELPCAYLRNTSITIDFAFGKRTFRIPIKNFMYELEPNLCVLGIDAAPEFFVLGDTFLESVYVVRDEDDASIWLAPAADCGSSPIALEPTTRNLIDFGALAVNSGSSVPVQINAKSISFTKGECESN